MSRSIHRFSFIGLHVISSLHSAPGSVSIACIIIRREYGLLDRGFHLGRSEWRWLRVDVDIDSQLIL